MLVIRLLYCFILAILLFLWLVAQHHLGVQAENLAWLAPLPAFEWSVIFLMVYFKSKNIQYASCVINPACSWELALLIWFCSFCSLSLNFKNTFSWLLYILECTWLQILWTVCYETAKILRCSRIIDQKYTYIFNLRNKLECNLSTLVSVTWLTQLVCKCCLEGLRNLSQSSDPSPVLQIDQTTLLSAVWSTSVLNSGNFAFLSFTGLYCCCCLGSNLSYCIPSVLIINRLFKALS